MPVFTSLGIALGGTAAVAATATTAAVAGTAFAIGVGAVGIAAGVGAAAFAAGGGFSDSGGEAPPTADARISPDTGALTQAEAQTAAKKRVFRSGVFFTSPTGLDSDARTSSAKLR